MDVRLRLSGDTPRRFILHTLQCREGISFRDTERREMMPVQPGVELGRSLAVAPGMTLEFCLAPMWNTAEEQTTVEYDLSFHGLVPDCREITLTADQAAARVEVAAPLAREMVSPSAKLETHRTLIAPSQAAIRPLGSRDRLPDGRQEFELLLSYSFEQPENGSVTPRLPTNDNLVYDSDLGTHVWLMFDAAKRRVAAGDIFAKPVQLAKGPHTLKLQLRHTDAALLERLKSTPLVLDRPLGASISLGVYRTHTAAIAGTPAFGGQLIDVGQQAAVYIKPPAADQLPSSAQPGDVLLGTIQYSKAEADRPGSGDRPGGFPLRFAVPPRRSTPAAAQQPGCSSAMPKDDWEFKLARLKALADPTSEEFDKGVNELLKDERDGLPVLVMRLHRLDTEDKREERLDRIVAAADAVIARIDAAKLAAHLGVKTNPDDAQAAAEHEKMTKQRDTLVDALYRKGRALGYMELPEVLEKRPLKDKAAHDKAFEATFADLRKWVDTTEASYYLLHIRRERRLGRPGKALELLSKHLPSQPLNKELFIKRGELCDELGWKHWASYERQWQIIRFPADYEGH
jgi:tripeptidyl-peptidase-2